MFASLRRVVDGAAAELVRPIAAAPEAVAAAATSIPEHVAIVGMGPSARQFLLGACRGGGRRALCDEVWGINALGDILLCDRIFHMDDVRVQEIRAKADPAGNTASMLKWLKRHPGPVITSRAHPDYPGLVEFPLEDVLNQVPHGYFNSTAAYAVAYAVYLGVKKLSCWGMDFTYPNAHQAEKGRACVEFWLGLALAWGIDVRVPQTSSLLDACNARALRFYGYDCVDLDFKKEGDRIKVAFAERAELPTAEEIEARYDHSQHPSPLINGEANE